MRGIGEDGWVQAENYENAVTFLKGMKEEALAGAVSEKEREEILYHWP